MSELGQQKVYPLWVYAAILLAFPVGWFGMKALFGGNAPMKMTTEEQALLLCQATMRAMALDAASAKVPYVPAHISRGDMLFAWGASTEHMRFRNNLGLETANSGSCIVNEATMAVIAVTFNGKTVK